MVYRDLMETLGDGGEVFSTMLGITRVPEDKLGNARVENQVLQKQ